MVCPQKNRVEQELQYVESEARRFAEETAEKQKQLDAAKQATSDKAAQAEAARFVAAQMISCFSGGPGARTICHLAAIVFAAAALSVRWTENKQILQDAKDMQRQEQDSARKEVADLEEKNASVAVMNDEHAQEVCRALDPEGVAASVGCTFSCWRHVHAASNRQIRVLLCGRSRC